MSAMEWSLFNKGLGGAGFLVEEKMIELACNDFKGNYLLKPVDRDKISLALLLPVLLCLISAPRVSMGISPGLDYTVMD